MSIEVKNRDDFFLLYDAQYIIMFSIGFAKKGHAIVSVANWGRGKLDEIFGDVNWPPGLGQNHSD